ncbi:TldD/PmbA family protein [Yunchengibacter salinarum]|uniref:TldD/PmbA family protein n=1 Tax=Yunchengibacter salinarum TaxID=3133399 RepID=UPI0035B67DB6
MTNSLDLLDDLITKALKAGADAADAVALEGVSRSAGWRDGQLEEMEGSEGEDIGLRVIFGHKAAIASSSERSPDALDRLVDRTVTMARNVPEDPYVGLAPEEALELDPIDPIAAELDLWDERRTSAEDLLALARQADEAARDVNGVTNSEGGSATAGENTVSMMTSHGFANRFRGSSFSIGCSALAGGGTDMQRDFDFTTARHFEDLDAAEQVGRTAGERAVARLNATRMTSGPRPVLFDPRVSRSLVGHFAGAINGNAVARGASFLKSRMGERLFPSGVDIIDDPKMRRGSGSRLFDGEGVRVTRQRLVADGTLKSWMLNSTTARQLNLPVTGHASRGAGSAPGISPSNLYLAAGDTTPADLMADVKDGLYVTELIGMGVNTVTGDYSRGAAGFRIEDGEIAEPVHEITIAGNLLDMFARLQVANDLVFKHGVNAPTVRIDDLMIAGA